MRQPASGGEPVIRFNFKNGTDDAEFKTYNFLNGSGDAPVSTFVNTFSVRIFPLCHSLPIYICLDCSFVRPLAICDQHHIFLVHCMLKHQRPWMRCPHGKHPCEFQQAPENLTGWCRIPRCRPYSRRSCCHAWCSVTFGYLDDWGEEEEKGNDAGQRRECYFTGHETISYTNVLDRFGNESLRMNVTTATNNRRREGLCLCGFTWEGLGRVYEL